MPKVKGYLKYIGYDKCDICEQPMEKKPNHEFGIDNFFIKSIDVCHICYRNLKRLIKPKLIKM